MYTAMMPKHRICTTAAPAYQYGPATPCITVEEIMQECTGQDDSAKVCTKHTKANKLTQACWLQLIPALLPSCRLQCTPQRKVLMDCRSGSHIEKLDWQTAAMCCSKSSVTGCPQILILQAVFRCRSVEDCSVIIQHNANDALQSLPHSATVGRYAKQRATKIYILQDQERSAINRTVKLSGKRMGERAVTESRYSNIASSASLLSPPVLTLLPAVVKCSLLYLKQMPTFKTWINTAMSQLHLASR